MKLRGKIVAADAEDKTITIKCDSSINGIIFGGTVVVQNDWPLPSDEPTEEELGA